MKKPSLAEVQEVGREALRRWMAVHAQQYLTSELGMSENHSSALLGIPNETLHRWKKRFEREGLAGLVRRKSPGRPKKGN